MRKVEWSPPDMGKEERDAILRVYDSGWVGEGPETKEFEREICDYIGCKHSIFMNNATSCLTASLLAQGIGPGDEVIVPTYTFIATINSIISVGATPVLVDIDKETWNTTPEIVKEKITPKTKAILPIDNQGLSVDIDAFQELADENKLVFIQDSAQSIGAVYKNKKVGNFKHTTVLSFHMAKTITTVEGGCVVTNDDKIADLCCTIRNHGMKGRYNYVTFGLNFRNTDIAAAMGRVQLKKIDNFIEHCNKIVDKYKEGLKGIGIPQKIPDYVKTHPWMLFGMLFDKEKEGMMSELEKMGIDIRSCWPPAHQQPYHKKYAAGEYPNADYVYKKIIHLPIGSGLPMEDVDYVIESIKNIINK